MKKLCKFLNDMSNLPYLTIAALSLILCIFVIFSYSNNLSKNVPTVRLRAEAVEQVEEITTPPEEEIPQEDSSEISIVFPTDKLFITDTRKDYVSGEMQLVIPSLEIDVPVLSDVSYETLKSSVGLYEYSQLPSDKYNSNVSIAGHRDIYGCEFYSIDKLAEGDVFYLIYKGEKYTYEYSTTDIVSDDDWSPIYSKEFSALTLTSCHPIGTSLKRMIITAKLSNVETLS